MNEYLVGALLFAIPIVAIVGGVAVTWIKAKHGLLETSEEFKAKLQMELAERDAVIAEHAERIKVLERIVTDSATPLEREIGRLKV